MITIQDFLNQMHMVGGSANTQSPLPVAPYAPTSASTINNTAPGQAFNSVLFPGAPLPKQDAKPSDTGFDQSTQDILDAATNQNNAYADAKQKTIPNYMQQWLDTISSGNGKSANTNPTVLFPGAPLPKQDDPNNAQNKPAPSPQPSPSPSPTPTDANNSTDGTDSNNNASAGDNSGAINNLNKNNTPSNDKLYKRRADSLKQLFDDKYENFQDFRLKADRNDWQTFVQSNQQDYNTGESFDNMWDRWMEVNKMEGKNFEPLLFNNDYMDYNDLKNSIAKNPTYQSAFSAMDQQKGGLANLDKLWYDTNTANDKKLDDEDTYRLITNIWKQSRINENAKRPDAYDVYNDVTKSIPKAGIMWDAFSPYIDKKSFDNKNLDENNGSWSAFLQYRTEHPELNNTKEVSK
jgi:hypothetical protein